MGLQLPPELITDIASYLTPESCNPPKATDLRNFRLTCSQFAVAGARYLTSTVYFSKYPYDLERLKDVSQHPIISKQIVHALCDDSRYEPKALDRPPWRDLINRYNLIAHKHRCTELQEFYEQMYSEQLQVTKQGLDLATFCAALSRMPNLRSIQISDMCNRPGPSHSTPVKSSHPWRTGNCPEIWPTNPPPNALWDQAVSPYHTFITVIRGLSLMDHEIRDLTVEGGREGISHRIFHASAEDTAHLVNVFKNLRDLELCIFSHDSEDLWMEKTMRSGVLGNVLAKALHLDSLGLHGCGNESFFAPVIFEFSSVLDQIIWSCLRRFYLGSFEIYGHVGLVKFLLSHRRTLVHVHLYNIGLLESDWAIVFAILRRKGVQLETCILTELYTSDFVYYDDVKDVLNYLLGVGDNPFLSPGAREPR